MNLFDINIVPINFNALARCMPFVHLFNYSYTFDRIVINTHTENENMTKLTDVDVMDFMEYKNIHGSSDDIPYKPSLVDLLNLKKA